MYRYATAWAERINGKNMCVSRLLVKCDVSTRKQLIRVPVRCIVQVSVQQCTIRVCLLYSLFFRLLLLLIRPHNRIALSHPKTWVFDVDDVPLLSTRACCNNSTRSRRFIGPVVYRLYVTIRSILSFLPSSLSGAVHIIIIQSQKYRLKKSRFIPPTQYRYFPLHCWSIYLCNCDSNL